MEKPKKVDDRIAPFEAVGIITAQSLGEPGTQMTMRTFHYAGVAEHVPTGLPRLIEIVDAKAQPKKPLIEIHLKEGYAEDEEKAKKVALEIEEVNMNDIAKIREELRKRTISIELNKKEMSRKLVKESDVDEAVQKAIGDKGSYKEGRIIFKKDVPLREIRRAFLKLKKLRISGVEGLSKGVVVKEGKEYFIRMKGSNIVDAMKHKAVDGNRIYTNDIKMIEKVFGIEAARNAIAREVKQVMDLQKLTVDVRHALLIADAMCFSGKVMGAGRYGLSGNKEGVLARAAFEETLKHLTKAASKAEADMLKGIVENIIVGQVIPVGTGRIELEYKESKKR
ncbi:MAG: hypothetical protein QW035_04270 [Candidatus Anstonellales archaeon]